MREGTLPGAPVWFFGIGRKLAELGNQMTFWLISKNRTPDPESWNTNNA